MPEPTQRTVKRICHICEAACGLNITLDGERVVHVRGNVDDVFSKGYVCAKGISLGELHNDPERLHTPLVRRQGQLVPVSWQQAFEFIAERLSAIRAAHGPSSCATYVGNPTAHNVELAVGLGPLLANLGSPNLFSAGSVDQIPKQVACGLLYGDFNSIPVPDVQRTDLLIVIGANPIVSNGSLWMVPNFRGQVAELHRRGGRMVVIDPRRTETAEIADQHHFIRPGTDALLLAAMLQQILEGQNQIERIKAKVVGLDALQAVVSWCSPALAALHCGIDERAIVELARQFANTPRAAIYGRVGTTLQRFGTLTSFLIEALNIVAGKLDVPGGAMFARAPMFGSNNAGAPGDGPGISIHRYASRVSRRGEVVGQLPVAVLAEEMETEGPGRIRALFTLAGNPLLSTPDGLKLRAAMQKLDLHVAIDIYLSDTAAMADVVLPGTSPLEHPHAETILATMTYKNVARISPSVQPLPDDRPSEWQMMMQLAYIARHGVVGEPKALRELDDAVVMGALAAACNDSHNIVAKRDPQRLFAMLEAKSGVERLMEVSLRTGPSGDGFGARTNGLTWGQLLSSPDGIDLGELSPRMPEVLKTPGGVIDLAPELICREMERLRASLEESKPEFVLIGQRNRQTNNTWLHNLPTLRKGPERCVLTLNPRDAERLKLHSGGRVRVSTMQASIEVEVAVSDEMMAGVVCMPHGFGHFPESGWSLARTTTGANSNLLASTSFLDEPTGTAALNGFAVEIVAV